VSTVSTAAQRLEQGQRLAQTGGEEPAGSSVVKFFDYDALSEWHEWHLKMSARAAYEEATA